MKIELHILQNFPPSNLNRDEAGAPKDCDFGGVRRARISSQCLKRSIRTSGVFEQALQGQVGKRTKRVPEEVAKRLALRGHDEKKARVLAEAFLSGVLKELADDGRTRYLYYIGPDELEEITEAINEQFEALAEQAKAAAAAREPLAEAEKRVKEAGDDDARAAAEQHRDQILEQIGEADAALANALKKPAAAFVDAHERRTGTVDVALFGRMLADEPRLNVDGACQVAHAISTNRVLMEFDYYTAVDDLQPEAEPGAGMIGTVGYNSSCYYRYALVDASQLAKNLRSDPDQDIVSKTDRSKAQDGVLAFLRGAVAAVPSGKKTSFAQQTPPLFVMAVVRNGSAPMSLVNAFERPARPHTRESDGKEKHLSLAEDSVEKLGRHWAALRRMYGATEQGAFVALLEGNVPDSLTQQGAEDVGTIDAIAERVRRAMDTWVETGDAREESQ